MEFPLEKTILSFYCDDTNPYVAPPAALKTFLDFVYSEGVAGESSVILGYDWTEHGLLSNPRNKVQSSFNEQLRRSYDCGIDSHFELMTHAGLFNFKDKRIPEGITHEGVWMYEPSVSVAEYEDYFRNIILEGEKIGIRFTGVTWPGCSCEACNRRYAELQADGINDPNTNVWQALINLASQKKFRGATIPCFFGGAEEHCAIKPIQFDRNNAIFYLSPNMEDRFGIWLNSNDYVNADYYISKDGKTGRIVELVQSGAPYALFYAHWQGLNPENGVGWKAFTTVVHRVQKYLGDEVIWMRPSQLTDDLFLKKSRG